jgi:hypothetical protein
MLEHLWCCIGLITNEHNAIMIPLPKLYDWRHSFGSTLFCYASFNKIRISGIPKRGTHCLQSCNGRHFSWIENELSNLRKTWPI